MAPRSPAGLSRRPLMGAALGGLVDVTDWSFLMLFVVVVSGIGLLLTCGVRRKYSEAQLAEQTTTDAERSG